MRLRSRALEQNVAEKSDIPVNQVFLSVSRNICPVNMPKVTPIRAESVGSASVEEDDDDLLLGRDSLGESASSTNLVELQAQSTLLRRLDSAFSQSGSGEPAVKQTPPLFELSSHILAQGVSAVVDDSFNRCFISTDADEWNWNIYLFPGWLVGVLIRYFIAFPLRLFALVLIFTASALFLGLVKVSIWHTIHIINQLKPPLQSLGGICGARRQRSWIAW